MQTAGREQLPESTSAALSAAPIQVIRKDREGGMTTESSRFRIEVMVSTTERRAMTFFIAR